ncbi:hypothetical protein [Streptacidiphilus rugosus]|uniref:hypothetical protein n=1 Tax=Streptacidiphilus rugosus TaxID=405783 RepID=UPI000AC06F16|nr:hypothetical protein [Streptacidiphilus rugosus]
MEIEPQVTDEDFKATLGIFSWFEGSLVELWEKFPKFPKAAMVEVGDFGQVRGRHIGDFTIGGVSDLKGMGIFYRNAFISYVRAFRPDLVKAAEKSLARRDSDHIDPESKSSLNDTYEQFHHTLGEELYRKYASRADINALGKYVILKRMGIDESSARYIPKAGVLEAIEERKEIARLFKDNQAGLWQLMTDGVNILRDEKPDYDVGMAKVVEVVAKAEDSLRKLSAAADGVDALPVSDTLGILNHFDTELLGAARRMEKITKAWYAAMKELAQKNFMLDIYNTDQEYALKVKAFGQAASTLGGGLMALGTVVTPCLIVGGVISGIGAAATAASDEKKKRSVKSPRAIAVNAAKTQKPIGKGEIAGQNVDKASYVITGGQELAEKALGFVPTVAELGGEKVLGAALGTVVTPIGAVVREKHQFQRNPGAEKSVVTFIQRIFADKPKKPGKSRSGFEVVLSAFMKTNSVVDYQGGWEGPVNITNAAGMEVSVRWQQRYALDRAVQEKEEGESYTGKTVCYIELQYKFGVFAWRDHPLSWAETRRSFTLDKDIGNKLGFTPLTFAEISAMGFQFPVWYTAPFAYAEPSGDFFSGNHPYAIFVEYTAGDETKQGFWKISPVAEQVLVIPEDFQLLEACVRVANANEEKVWRDQYAG